MKVLSNKCHQNRTMKRFFFVKGWGVEEKIVNLAPEIKNSTFSRGEEGGISILTLLRISEANEVPISSHI